MAGQGAQEAMAELRALEAMAGSLHGCGLILRHGLYNRILLVPPKKIPWGDIRAKLTNMSLRGQNSGTRALHGLNSGTGALRGLNSGTGALCGLN